MELIEFGCGKVSALTAMTAVTEVKFVPMIVTYVPPRPE